MAVPLKNEGYDFDMKAGFFPRFPACCLAIVFLAVTMAPRQRPFELLLTVPPLDQQNLSDYYFLPDKMLLAVPLALLMPEVQPTFVAWGCTRSRYGLSLYDALYLELVSDVASRL